MLVAGPNLGGWVIGQGWGSSCGSLGDGELGEKC